MSMCSIARIKMHHVRHHTIYAVAVSCCITHTLQSHAVTLAHKVLPQGRGGKPSEQTGHFWSTFDLPSSFHNAQTYLTYPEVQVKHLKMRLSGGFFNADAPDRKCMKEQKSCQHRPSTALWLIYDQVLFVGPVDWTVNCRKYRQVLKHTWNAHTS